MPEPDLRWHDFLDRIESDAAAGLACLEDPSLPVHVDLWIPPQDLGAMPPELAERALNVLAAQQKIRERMQGARTAAGKQLAALRSVPEPVRNGQSVYLDVTS